jgi:cytochrome P450
MKLQYPDGPKINLALAILGQMMPERFPFDPLAFGVGIAREFGDIAHYTVGPMHVYQVNHPNLARQILVEQAEKFHKAKLVKRALRPFAGDGLFTSDGALWKQQRKLMQPAFHQRQLAAYADVMVTHAQGLTETFVDQETRDVGADMTKVTLGIVVKALFGADLPREAGEIAGSMVAVLDAVNQRMNYALKFPSWVPTARNIRERRALVKLDAMLQVLIAARRSASEGRDDLLSVLLAAVDEEGGRMSERQLRDEMMTLFLAGHETTAGALTWTWYLLSQHPAVEAKLHEEIDRVLAGREPGMSDLVNLPYSDMVIRESMRLYPPAPGIAREPVEDVSIGGYDVRKGSLIVIHSYAMQRDDRYFPDAERYDPERFAAGWEERIPRYAYLPFGSGPRGCIGNSFAMIEARLVLVAMAQKFRLALPAGETVRPVQLVTLRPSGPLRMRVARRER